MGSGNYQDSTSKSETTENYADSRTTAADNAVATHNEGGVTNVSYTIESSDTSTLKSIASGAASLLATLSGNETDLLKSVSSDNSSLLKTLASGSNSLASSALSGSGSAISTAMGLKQTELTGGASDLQKTVLIGLGLGVAGMVLVAMIGRKKA